MLFKNRLSIDNVRKNVVGIDKKIMLRNGKKTNYICFDNAASTPTLVPVLEKVNEFLEWYSSIHRGTGYKSVISTRTYDDSRKIVADFLNADFEKNVVIYVKNSTEAINKLSYRLQLDKNDVVISSLMEHHSNDLPWRNKCKTLFANVLQDGRLDLDDLEKKLASNKGKVKLVAITGCSNVTGYINDIHYIASLSHRHGAKILVDAAQLAPHRSINMKGKYSDDYLDFVVLSGHKLYAPFGIGVLVGPKSTFQSGKPEYTGGGTIISVSQNNIYYAAPPEREEAGSPNIVGAVALAESIKAINEIGMDKIAKHEMELTKYLLKNLTKLPRIKIYSNTKEALFPNMAGVVSFNIPDLHHSLLASLLAYEGGIGVRNGCFCAHPYVHRLLNLTPSEIRKLQQDMMFGRFKNVPGLVRISFGMYNTIQEIDVFLNILSYIIENKKRICDEYKYISSTGKYEPKNLPKNIYSEFTL